MKRDDERGIDERSRGANESVRWLRACAVQKLGEQGQCVALLDEGRQLARILGKVVVTSKRRDEEEGAEEGGSSPFDL